MRVSSRAVRRGAATFSGSTTGGISAKGWRHDYSQTVPAVTAAPLLLYARRALGAEGGKRGGGTHKRGNIQQLPGIKECVNCEILVADADGALS